MSSLEKNFTSRSGAIGSDKALSAIDIKRIENRIIKLIQDRASIQRIKSTVAIKDVNRIIKSEFGISEADFVDLMMRLYRKQVIDLQPGGSPGEYTLQSPTGSRFYYVSLKK